MCVDHNMEQQNFIINGDIIAGTFLITGDRTASSPDGAEGGTTELTDEQIAKYTKMFEADESYTPEEVVGSAGFYIFRFY